MHTLRFGLMVVGLHGPSPAVFWDIQLTVLSRASSETEGSMAMRHLLDFLQAQSPEAVRLCALLTEGQGRSKRLNSWLHGGCMREDIHRQARMTSLHTCVTVRFAGTERGHANSNGGGRNPAQSGCFRSAKLAESSLLQAAPDLATGIIGLIGAPCFGEP